MLTSDVPPGPWTVTTANLPLPLKSVAATRTAPWKDGSCGGAPECPLHLQRLALQRQRTYQGLRRSHCRGQGCQGIVEGERLQARLEEAWESPDRVRRSLQVLAILRAGRSEPPDDARRVVQGERRGTLRHPDGPRGDCQSRRGSGKAQGPDLGHEHEARGRNQGRDRG